MAYPSIAVSAAICWFGSAGGYAIFNFYRMRDGSATSEAKTLAQRIEKHFGEAFATVAHALGELTATQETHGRLLERVANSVTALAGALPQSLEPRSEANLSAVLPCFRWSPRAVRIGLDAGILQVMDDGVHFVPDLLDLFGQSCAELLVQFEDGQALFERQWPDLVIRTVATIAKPERMFDDDFEFFITQTPAALMATAHLTAVDVHLAHENAAGDIDIGPAYEEVLSALRDQLVGSHEVESSPVATVDKAVMESCAVVANAYLLANAHASRSDLSLLTVYLFISLSATGALQAIRDLIVPILLERSGG